MAPSHKPDPALLFPVTDFIACDIMAQKQIASGMYFHTTIFVNMPVDKVEFTDAAALLHTYVLTAKGHSDIIKLRDAQSELVHGYLMTNLLYAKIVCNHDVTLIGKSGYNSTHEPQQASEPETTGVVRVTKGKKASTYKVYLAKKKTKEGVIPDPKSKQKGVRYTIQLSTTPDDANSWKTVAEGCSFYQLIFSSKDVVQLKKNHVRVYGVNAAGKGQPNAPFPFTPEIE